jgi:hypothetical protein
MGKISDERRLQSANADLLENQKIVLGGGELPADFGAGTYQDVNDRKGPVSRYLKYADMPSAIWTAYFVEAGGSFDSEGSWGITPETGCSLEERAIHPEFAGKMLDLMGRADYGFLDGLCLLARHHLEPKTRGEFHASVRGIHRQNSAKMADIKKLKSIMRYGWMKEKKWAEYILENSRRIFTLKSRGTSYYSFNGVNIEDIDPVKNPLFKKWILDRPNAEEMDRRRGNRSYRPKSVGQVKKVPTHLMAAAMRNSKDYFSRDPLRNTYTSKGYVYDTGDGIHLIHSPQGKEETIKSRKIGNLRAANIGGQWFVWGTEKGFQEHLENPSLREALRLWKNRSRKGEPRALCLNEVRNDRSGTAGFCFFGVRKFLEAEMPFVYSLVKEYKNWNSVPEDIMSQVWDIDFKVFKGYPIP